MAKRLLLEEDVVKTVDRHITGDYKLDDDISCILEEVKSVGLIGSEKALDKNKLVEKEKRVQLFENDDIVLEQRGNRYYLSLYDKEGKFQREVTVAVKDGFKVALANDK